MPTFTCAGWLHVTLFDDSDTAYVKISHEDDHVSYCNIAVPPHIQEYVQSNSDLNPRKFVSLVTFSFLQKFWNHILKTWYPDSPPPFMQKSMYCLWAAEDQKKWKRDDNEVKSAKILLEEAAKFEDVPGKGLYAIEPIPLPMVVGDGFTAIAFALPGTLQKFGGRIREIALDSAWNTNHSLFEIFALLGEVYGSGLPLGYLLIQSNQGDAGGKERYLNVMLGHFNTKWDLRVIAALSDKDWSEINTFLARYPEAKHQLCLSPRTRNMFSAPLFIALNFFIYSPNISANIPFS
ncbi:hypothetical protein C8J56DRAFT_799033 [Mycena floridula]|nr:hypothetical protein C8J56DRAFT_799033 [Mycena floridula]